MLPGIATIIWAYAVARLLQIPVEYEGSSLNGRAWLIVTSGIGIVVATFAYFGVLGAARTVSPTP